MTRNDDRTAQSGSAQGAVDRWEHERASGRTRFILRRGVLSWGIPAAFLTVFYKFVQEQGLVWSPRMTDSLRTAIVVAVIVFPLCGWIFGRWLWDTGETRYKARVREDVSGPSGR